LWPGPKNRILADTYHRYRSPAFKRVQAGSTIIVSNRALGFDLRETITAGGRIWRLARHATIIRSLLHGDNIQKRFNGTADASVATAIFCLTIPLGDA
jgi:hypothetical protein